MTADFVPTERPDNRFRRLAEALAMSIAVLGWLALGIEFERSISLSLSKGRGWGEALFLYVRFFTILTNIGIATLMSVSSARLLTGARLPPTRIFNAALVYILVTSATYEWLLRSQWHPTGLQFYTDLVIHDIVPALMLVFWVAFAPRDGARWRDALWGLVYPAVYFMVTLIAGALGADYPYSFLDVDRLGYTVVFAIGLVFIAVFYGLGLATAALAMVRAPGGRANTVVADRSGAGGTRSPRQASR